MAKNYEVGEKYYLPVTVRNIFDGYKYSVGIEFIDSEGYETIEETAIANEPDLLLTAYEVYECQVTALKEEISTLKSENERLSKQNEELGAKVDDLEADLQNAKAAIDYYHEVEHRRVGYADKQTQAINRKDKEIEILIDRITKLEAELAEKREQNNG